jgi:WD40 repeat protein
MCSNVYLDRGVKGLALFWDLHTSQKLGTVGPSSKPMTAAGFLPDGKRALLMTAEERNRARLDVWDVPKNKCSRSIEVPGLSLSSPPSAIVRPDGRQVVLGSFGGQVRLLDRVSGTVVRTYKVHDHRARVQVLDLSPDGSKVLSTDFVSPGTPVGNDPRIKMQTKLWSLATGEVIHTFGKADGLEWAGAHRVIPCSHPGLLFSRDGKLLLSNLDKWPKRYLQRIDVMLPFEGHVFLWDASSGKVVAEITAGDSLAHPLGLSADGKRIWLRSGNRLRLWDRDTAKVVWSMQLAAGELPFLSPDRKLLLTAPRTATGTPDRYPDLVFKLWDAQTGKLVRTLRGPEFRPFPKR